MLGLCVACVHECVGVCVSAGLAPELVFPVALPRPPGSRGLAARLPGLRTLIPGVSAAVAPLCALRSKQQKQNNKNSKTKCCGYALQRPLFTNNLCISKSLADVFFSFFAKFSRLEVRKTKFGVHQSMQRAGLILNLLPDGEFNSIGAQ